MTRAQTSDSGRIRSMITANPGPRSTEAELLATLTEALQGSARNLDRLGKPVRILVPSRSLAHHLGRTIPQHFGRPVLGVVVQSLYGFASSVFSEAGETPPRESCLFELFSRRFARDEPVLRRSLDHLSDGYGAVAASVRDLLDAGLHQAPLSSFGETLDRASEQDSLPSSEITRARALLGVAVKTSEALSEWGLGLSSDLFRRASDLLESHPQNLPPSRRLLIYGMNDATGAATRLVRTLLDLKTVETHVFLDSPPDPLRPSRPDPGAAFADRFRQRLGRPIEMRSTPEGESPADGLKRFHAPGAQAEVREIAQRIRLLLDRGAIPETIGVVTRDLNLYRTPLRIHFHRLGIPFSSPDAKGPLTPAGRRLQALIQLLSNGENAVADRWLDAAYSKTNLLDLRLALRALGAARLAEVAELDLPSIFGEDRFFRLPVRRGIWSPERELEEDPDPDVEPRAYRRRVSKSAVTKTVSQARSVLERLSRWHNEATLSTHLETLQDFLTKGLGWNETTPGHRETEVVLDSLKDEIPPPFVLSQEELVLLLRKRLSDAGRLPLGGDGGGVRVLDVTAARSISFRSLFLLGLNRDVFPRSVREDPLLTDAVRRLLAPGLPDLAQKRAGHDEERYLFAQLLASSPHLTLSWQSMDDDGRPRSASPLVERLRFSATGDEPRPPDAAPPLFASVDERGREGIDPNHPLLPSLLPVPAHEEAIMAGLFGTRSQFAAVLPLALQELDRDLGKPRLSKDSRLRAQSRIRVLEELDPDLRTAEGRKLTEALGPYFGFVGPAENRHDPRNSRLFVTTVENAAKCPWSTALERLLKLEPSPDPLEALPTVDALMLGSLVHAVLEWIVRNADPELDDDTVPLDEARARSPVAVAWPTEDELEKIVSLCSQRLLQREGIHLPGLATVLAERARPLLLQARESDWGDDGLPTVLGAELLGRVEIHPQDGEANRPWTLFFKADRIDQAGTSLVLTDYKTGKSVSEAKRPATREQHFLDQVRRGERLQTMAYALGAGAGSSLGRYLFLKDTVSPDARIVEAKQTTPMLEFAFRRAAITTLRAFDRGSFFPRLVEPDGTKEPAKCRFCNVAEACLRGDSGARRRLVRWMQSQPRLDPRDAGDTRVESIPLAPTAEAAAVELYYLASKSSPPRKPRLAKSSLDDTATTHSGEKTP